MLSWCLHLSEESHTNKCKVTTEGMIPSTKKISRDLTWSEVALEQKLEASGHRTQVEGTACLGTIFEEVWIAKTLLV